MSTSKNPASGVACAQDLLDRYETLAIPHFQRGSVWDSGSVALLLESLYHSTPCGSIVLWSPRNAAGLGVPLGTNADTLVVDGQQRIRSLYEVFAAEKLASIGKTGGDDGEDEEEEEDAPETSEDSKQETRSDGFWCLNLARVPGLEERFKGGLRFKLFRRVRDPWMASRREGTPPAGYHALLPLKWFGGRDDEALRDLVQHGGQDAVLTEAVKAALEMDEVRARLRQMLTCKVFHVARLDPASTVGEVVEIYNRINTAGRRVEAEERAFANLVAVHPGALDELKRFFEQIEGQAVTEVQHGLERDDLLQRQRENRFGFKLFMRAFCMVLAYHRDRSVGSSAISFNMVTRDALELGSAKEHLPEVLKQTVSSLSSVRKLLSDTPVCLDDLRMLPDSTSLWPVLQLLIRFPGLSDGVRHRLASIALRLLLANLPQQRLLELVAAISSERTAERALARFDIRGTRLEEVRKRVEPELKRAQSLQNRLTLLLYPLLRHRGAMDFSYDVNLRQEQAAKLMKRYGADGLALRERLEVEKQHIVPYSLLKAVFQIGEGARPGRHEAHDIGNLTYISSGMNSFETGIGSKALALGKEPEDNRQAHCISEAMIRHYENVVRPSGRATGESDGSLKKAYRKMCRARREELLGAFREWLEEVDAKGRAERVPAVSPVIRLIRQRDEDTIEALGLPQAVTEVLIALCEVEGMRKARKKESRFCKGYNVPSGEPGRQLLRINIPENAAKPVIELKVTDAQVEKPLKLCPPGVRLVYESFDNRKYHIDPEHDGAAAVLLDIKQTLEAVSSAAKKPRKKDT